MITRHLQQLSLPDPDARRNALEQVLEQEGISYAIQSEKPSEQIPRGVRNYLFSTGADASGAPECAGSKRQYLFCAHYDAYPGSPGANDNASSLCILIDLYYALKEKGIPAWFAFLDGEESGFTGSILYRDCMEKSDPHAAINLDLCGFGDTIVLNAGGSEKSRTFLPFCNDNICRQYGNAIVKYLPDSDDTVLRKAHIPTLGISVVPRWDVQYLKSLGAMGSGLLGRSPEFKMIVSSMEVCTTMHGAYRDKVETVQPEAMQKVLDYLTTVMSHPVPRKTLRDLL